MSTKKILVADDDASILDAISLILQETGYDVVTTNDGNTVRNLKGDLPDLLLLDIWMSGEDGGEICRQLKANETTATLPILIVSAHRDTEQIARDAGADDFILKPFDMEELLKKIDLQLNKQT